MIKDPDGLTQPIIDIYNQIEYDLIIDIAKRFDTYDTIGGTLEWQLKKLDELGTLNADMVKTIAKYSKKSQKEIYDMLKSAGFANIDFEDLQKAYSAGAILVDPVTIRNNTVFAELVELSYKELDETFRMIQTKALESAKQSYMDVINRAYIEVATGTYDYNTSIRNAIQRMAENGITGATYKRGEKIVKYSLEATVRRDTLTAVHKLANQSSDVMCEEIGTDYVEISSHLGARVHLTNKIANHAGWQGKVYKIHGEDPEYPNLKESTGYPDDILGLGGVNCRHRMFPFVPGISTPNPINFSEEENRKAYELSQQQRKLERDMRKLKKKKAAAEAMGDKETAKKLKEKIKLKSDEIDKFCEDNKLKRDYNRELVTEQITKKVAKTEKSDIIKTREMSNGMRKSPFYILNDEEIKAIKTEADNLGIPKNILRFNEGDITGFVDSQMLINIRGNILPDLNSANIRDRLSVKSVLAHEYYGHYKNHPSSFRIGDWRDEFRASYCASIDAPNLTDEERRLLMIDAYDRAKEAGVKVNYNNKARRIIYGSDE